VAAAASIAVLVVAGGWLVAASSSSLPGQPLYSVKTAVENVRLALTPSYVGKVKLLASFVDRRVNEIVLLVEGGGDSWEVDMASVALKRHLGRMTGLLEASPARNASDGALMSRPGLESSPAVSPSPTTTAMEKGDTLVPSLEEAGSMEEVRDALQAEAMRHQAILEGLRGKASEDTRPAVLRALQRASSGYRQLLGDGWP
jgi:hypothetical protein